MEDRYIYRGKIKGSNTNEHPLDWAYGNLVVELKTNKYFIMDLNFYNKNTRINDAMLEVIPETVGQCTGLKDKNSTLIYEGDILEYGLGLIWRYKVTTIKGTGADWGSNLYLKTIYRNFRSIVDDITGDVRNEIKCDFYVNEGKKELMGYEDKGLYNMKIIGNIYENSELFKGD